MKCKILKQYLYNIKKIEFAIKKLPIEKSPSLHGCTDQFNKMFKEELTPILQSVSENRRKGGTIQFML